MNPIETTGRAVEGARKLLASKERLQIAEERLSKADLLNELAVLRKRNAELEAEIERKEKLTYRPPFFFREDDPFPYCKHCYQVNKQAVYLDAPFEHADGGFGYPCGSCAKVYRVEKLLPDTKVVPVTASSHPEVASVPRSSSVRDLFRDGW